MRTITISTQNSETYSSISNFFIDYYMTDANGEFVKVYLYLIRLLSSKTNISVAEIADHFNLTEKDICRAIKYWVTKEALRLTFDGNGNPTGIVILPLSAPNMELAMSADAVSLLRSDAVVNAPQKKEVAATTETVEAAPTSSVERTAPAKKKYTATEISSFATDEDWENLIIYIEALWGKTVSQADIQCLLHIYDNLGFDTDLFEYLIEYCETLGKKSSRYMEAVAINWYQEGIRTKLQAKEQYGTMTSTARTVYKALGIKRNVPTTIELEYFNIWTKDFGFTEDIIQLACERAVLHSNNPNIKYVNGILEDWNRNNVSTIADIKALDQAYANNKEKATPASSKPKAKKPNNFNNFTQTDLSDELAEIEALIEKEVKN